MKEEKKVNKETKENKETVNRLMAYKEAVERIKKKEEK